MSLEPSGTRDVGPTGSGPGAPGIEDEEFWREFLTQGHRGERAARRLLKHLPAAPRCKACAAPFKGLGGTAMRLVGKGPSDTNPNLCNSCFGFLRKHRGGAEIEVTMLFADIRGSTTLAEAMSATDFHSLLERFYGVATRVVFDHDGSVDKFVGDEVVAMFFPLASGERHASQAIAAARALMRETGHAEGMPWAPVGAGVHTGRAWVGAMGDATHVELTAVGDAVNIAARLASVAGAGEILVSVPAARHASLEAENLERRVLTLKGKAESVQVIVLT